MEKRLVRIKFEKMGDIKYISHLDMGRTFQRALRRIEAPLWFSEGFSPHPKLNFALPLSVGSESLCELLDVALTADSPKGSLEGLREQLPAGIRILEIDEAPEKKLSLIEFCSYTLTFPQKAELYDKAKEYFSKPVTVEKKGKGKTTEIELSSLIRRIRWKTDGHDLAAELMLPAGGERGYLSPELVVKGFEADEELKQLCDDCRIVRTGLYTSDEALF